MRTVGIRVADALHDGHRALVVECLERRKRGVEAAEVVALAHPVGGVREAWLTAIFGVVLSAAAGAVGAFVPAIGWKAPAVVVVLLALVLAFA